TRAATAYRQRSSLSRRFLVLPVERAAGRDLPLRRSVNLQDPPLESFETFREERGPLAGLRVSTMESRDVCPGGPEGPHDLGLDLDQPGPPLADLPGKLIGRSQQSVPCGRDQLGESPTDSGSSRRPSTRCSAASACPSARAGSGTALDRRSWAV